MKFLRSIYSPPTPLEQASSELEQARRDLLQASAWAEHYESHRKMLVGRVSRLKIAVAELAQEEGPTP